MVYTWVDGSDEQWWAGKARYQAGPSDIPQRYPAAANVGRDEL